MNFMYFTKQPEEQSNTSHPILLWPFPGSFSYNVLCLWYHVCLVAPLLLTFSIPYVVFYMEIREYSNFWSFIFESERCCDLQHRISLLT